jgi:predicted amidohydrolase YtcJ
MIVRDALHPLAAHADDDMELGLDLGIRTGFGDDWLRIGAMKVFTDGSLVGRTAAMHDDFAGIPGNRGYLQGEAEDIQGTLAPGMLADMAVLSEDPTAVSPQSIAGIGVLATFVDGQCRYESGGAVADLR